MADEKQQILDVLHAQEAATARSDAAGVMAPVAVDAISYDLPPPLEHRGKPARAIDVLDQWFASWEDGVTVSLKDPTVVIDGDLAVVFGLSRMRGAKKDQGTVDIWNRRTVALRRHDGKWQIVHDHQSYPMKMDGSEKAALDLKPE